MCVFVCFQLLTININPIFSSNLQLTSPYEQSNGELITKSSKSRLKFPRIAIKLRPGQVTVREKETILDEKISQRTEEISDPITGEPTLQTFEYVEKTIEKEVSENFFPTIFRFLQETSAFFN